MLSTVLTVILAVVGVILCVLVLLQSDRQAGLGAVSAASTSSDSYWSKNKGSSLEGQPLKAYKNPWRCFYDTCACYKLYLRIIWPAYLPAFILFKKRFIREK